MDEDMGVQGQARLVKLRLSTQARCDASATASIGKSEAVCGLYGPLETRVSSNVIEGGLEVSFKSHAMSTSTQEDADFSLLIKESLQRCLKTLPRTTISLSVRVLAEEGCGFSVAVAAAVGALIDGGIAMTKIPAGVELILKQDGTFDCEPRPEDRPLARARMFFVFCGDEEGPSAWISNGSCSMEEMHDAVAAGWTRAMQVRQDIESTLKSTIPLNKDLCM